MKAKIILTAVILALFVTSGFAQDKSKKQRKEEKKIEKQKQVEDLINSKEFVFVARQAMPTGYKTVNLTTNPNYVKYHPEIIESYMPFFGRAFSGIGYGGESGLHFEGKAEEYTFTKGKKNYQVDATVKDEKDTYWLILTVGFEGNASLIISSNNRSAISYSGEISAPKIKKEKK